MKVAVVFADGFEEIEALSVVDILRRAELEALCVGLESETVRGAHDVNVKMDMLLADLRESDFSAIVLPGGLPGAQNLADSAGLGELLRKFNAAGKPIAAICAAPMALAKHGVLKRQFTCYPGFESRVREDKAGYVSVVKVLNEDNIITSRGPATAMEFALAIVRELCGEEKYRQLREDLLVDMA